MYLLSPTHCRSRRRQTCGRCEAGRSKSPTNMYQTPSVQGRNSECPSSNLATHKWYQNSFGSVSLNEVLPLESCYCMLARWFINKGCFSGGICTAIGWQIKRETWVEAESERLNTTTERLDTGLASCMNLRPTILTGSVYGPVHLFQHYWKMTWKIPTVESKLCSQHRWGHSGFKELYPEEFKSDG